MKLSSQLIRSDTHLVASEECPCVVEWEGKSDLMCARCCERVIGKIVAVFTYILRGALF